MLWPRIAVVIAVFVLLPYQVPAVAEERDDIISREGSSNDLSSSEEEMVCSSIERETSGKVGVDGADTQNHDEFDEDDDDDDDDDGIEDEIVEEIIDDEECTNQHKTCEHWAGLEPSECEVNPKYMLDKCKLACKACKKHKRYSNILPTKHGRDLGEAQSFRGDKNVSSEEIEKRVAASQKYMLEQNELGTIDIEFLRMCKNKNKECTYWSIRGECDKNPSFMKSQCGPACFSCDMLDLRTRCPMDRETIGPDIWQPGDLDRMFRRLSSEPYKSQYDVNVLSSPDSEEEGPWVLTIDNFISNEESERLIELGSTQGYKRSTGVGKKLPDGSWESLISTERTSWNTWCRTKCKEDELVRAVHDRISNMTEIPLVHSENFQLLRYEPGQFYKVHHDYIVSELNRQAGVRLITAYLYLNDVEAGGGTNFPWLNITVMPKRGRVLIWPHVFDSDPNKKDKRTDHQALKVESGVKYGANAWYHIRNYQRMRDNDC